MPNPYIVKEVLQIGIVRPVTKMCLEQLVNATFQHDAVVHRHHADLRHSVPAGLPTARDAVVHDVVGHQEVRLQLWARCVVWWYCTRPYQLDAPAKEVGFKDLLVGQHLRVQCCCRRCDSMLTDRVGTLDCLQGVQHSHATVELATRDVVVGICCAC